MEDTPRQDTGWFERLSSLSKPHTQPQAKAKQQARKRTSMDQPAKDAPTSGPHGGSRKKQKATITQEELLTPEQVEARRRSQDKEGFSQIFKRRTQEPHRTSDEEEPLLFKKGSTLINGPHSDTEAVPDGPGTTALSLTGQASSSRQGAGSHSIFSTSNSFQELEERRKIEEIAVQAEHQREDRIRDSWDQESRNTDIANRKQSWHAEKYRKTDSHREGIIRLTKSHASGSGPHGIRKGSRQRSPPPSGSTGFSTKGPGAAGGPGPPELPSASEGADREEAGAPLGQLVQGAGREAGPLEPLAAPMVTGTGQGSVGHFSSGMADQTLQVGALVPALTQAFPGAGHPGRATGRSALVPD